LLGQKPHVSRSLPPEKSTSGLFGVPAATITAPNRPRVDNAMIKALARAFRWRKLLETGANGTIEELAAAERINSSYVSHDAVGA
jgi:hypothetical protein